MHYSLKSGILFYIKPLNYVPKGVEVQLNAFLTWALHAGEWLTSRYGRFNSGEGLS